MDHEIFYPNKLTAEEIENLSGWKLKVASIHFGLHRDDCVRFGYGYSYFKWVFDDKKEIYLVADKDDVYERPISLATELDWNDKSILLEEIGVDVNELLRNHIKEQLGYDTNDTQN